MTNETASRAVTAVGMIATLVNNVLVRTLTPADQGDVPPYVNRQWYPKDAPRAMQDRVGWPVCATAVPLEGSLPVGTYGSHRNGARAWRELTKHNGAGWKTHHTLFDKAAHRESLRVALYQLVEEMSAVNWTDLPLFSTNDRIAKCEMCGTGGSKRSRPRGKNITFPSAFTAKFHSDGNSEGLRQGVPDRQASLTLCTLCYKDLARAATVYPTGHYLTAGFTVLISDATSNELSAFTCLNKSGTYDISAFPRTIHMGRNGLAATYVENNNVSTPVTLSTLGSINRVDLVQILKMSASSNPCSLDLPTTITAGTIPSANHTSTCLCTAITFLLMCALEATAAQLMAAAIVAHESSWQNAIKLTATLLSLTLTMDFDNDKTIYTVEKFVSGPNTSHIVATEEATKHHSDYPHPRPQEPATHRIHCTMPTSPPRRKRLNFLRNSLPIAASLTLYATHDDYTTVAKQSRCPVSLRKVAPSDVAITLV